MSERSGATGFFQVAGTREILEAFSGLVPREPERVPLLDALGRALARDAVASIDIPHFTRSSMDGYAVAAADTFGASESQPAYLSVRGAVAMGAAPAGKVGAGEAMRIATGGMLPHGADAVVMREHTREGGDLLDVFRPVAPGEHVVTGGEDVREGERVLAAGRVLRPAGIGLLAGLGATAVDVVRRPRVAVVSTGDELVGAEETPGPGQIRNVNQYSPGAWVRRCGGEPLLLGRAPDDTALSISGVRMAVVTTMRVTDSGTPALSATNSFTVSVLGKPVPASGLVSWWTGDGTTADQNALNDGALAGTASYAPGLYGQAFNFNGGYLAVLHSASLSFAPANALSVEMWVKRSQPGYPAYYFGKRVGCGAYNYQSPSDQISGGFYDPPVGEWRHFAWVFTGTEWQGYVNGVLIYRTQTSLEASNSAALFIGTSGTCGQPFVGLIDEARLYNRALTSNEVALVYAGSALGPPIISQQPQSQWVASGSTVVTRRRRASVAR